MNTPSDLVHAFASALTDGDPAALDALCTPHGLEADGDSIGRFIRRALSRDLRFTPLAELVEADSRAAICGLVRAKTSGRQHGRLWLHAVKRERWLLEGMTQTDTTAALFVSGVIPAIFDARALPPSPVAERWAGPVLDDAIAHPDALVDAHGPLVAEGFETIANDTVGELVLIGTHQIGATARHAIGFGRQHGPDDIRQTVWFALQGDPPRVIGHSFAAASALTLTEPAG